VKPPLPQHLATIGNTTSLLYSHSQHFSSQHQPSTFTIWGWGRPWDQVSRSAFSMIQFPTTRGGHTGLAAAAALPYSTCTLINSRHRPAGRQVARSGRDAIGAKHGRFHEAEPPDENGPVSAVDPSGGRTDPETHRPERTRGGRCRGLMNVRSSWVS